MKREFLKEIVTKRMKKILGLTLKNYNEVPLHEGNNYCLKDIKLPLYSPVNKYVFMEVLEGDLAKFIFHQI